MEQANAIRHRTQDLVRRDEATIVVRKLIVAQLREQQQSLYGWHALCHSGKEQVHPLLKTLWHRTRRWHLIGRCRSPQGGGTGPGRVRTGRACCAVEVVRPSRGPEEDATGPPAEART